MDAIETKVEWIIHYDDAARHWVIQQNQQAGGVVTTKDLTIDGEAESVGNKLVVTGILRASGLSNAVGSFTDAKAVMLLRAKEDELVGTPPKHDPMLDWQFTYDMGTGRWVFLLGDAVVSTKQVRFNTTLVSKGKFLTGHVELIVNGATNKGTSEPDAKTVFARTLRVFDQTVRASF